MTAAAARRAGAALLAATLGSGSGLAAGVKIDSATFGGLRARSIGPAEMSGRIAAIDAVPQDPLVVYIGAASGGVWRSRDGGVVWKPVFDENTQSIGAIRVDPQDPDTVWVGTGESWTRNSTSVGTGVYKSVDGGDSWNPMGLADSERIARIVVHPRQSDTVYVCATGHLWDANEERGVYRTIDGGENWERVATQSPVRRGRGREVRVVPLGRPGLDLREAEQLLRRCRAALLLRPGRRRSRRLRAGVQAGIHPVAVHRRREVLQRDLQQRRCQSGRRAPGPSRAVDRSPESAAPDPGNRRRGLHLGEPG